MLMAPIGKTNKKQTSLGCRGISLYTKYISEKLTIN